MANRRRSTRRRRRAPIRPAVRRPTAAAETPGRLAAAPMAGAPASTTDRRAVSLPSLRHLRRDLALSAGLGFALTLVVVVAGLATG